MDGMIFISRVTSFSPGLRFGQSAPISDDSPWLAGGISAAECVAAYHFNGAASQAASYANLANPGVYTIPGTGVPPTWDATNGLKSNGTQWLATGITPASGWSTIIQVSNMTTTSRTIYGFVAVSGGVNRHQVVNSATGITYSSGASSSAIAPTATAGTFGIAGAYGFRNGVQDAGPLTAGASNWLGMYLFAQNRDGTATDIITAYIKKFYVYNTTRTAAQMLALTNAMIAI